MMGTTCSKCHAGAQALAIPKSYLSNIDSKLKVRIHLNTSFRFSVLLSRSRQYGVYLSTEVYFVVHVEKF